MGTLSTTSYVPLDSDAPAVFSETRTSRYLMVAFLWLLLYDYFITLDKEIEWIWTLRWRLPKIIFLINRYIVTFLTPLAYTPYLFFPLSVSFCHYVTYLGLCVAFLNFGAVELLLIIRVCSLYGHHKLVVWSLGIFFIFAFVSAIAAQALSDRLWHGFLYYESLPGCWVWWSGSKTVSLWLVWTAFLSVEGVLMLLTVYKLLSYRNQLNRTITLLARDSLAYFVIVFACMASILATDVEGSIVVSMIQIPTQCITSIAVGHMMMNIRGLILDDPEHTMHLQTLQFAAHSNSGQEAEEVG